MVVNTSGILAGENRRMLVVCQSHVQGGELSECLYIMKKCIISRTDKQKKKNADAGPDLRPIRSLPEE